MSHGEPNRVRVTPGVDAQRAQRLGGIDAFKLRLGTREQPTRRAGSGPLPIVRPPASRREPLM
ncbi:MAG: hypothetical protein ACLP8S_07230 [Solirubrobacteraceae bacterium]